MKWLKSDLEEYHKKREFEGENKTSEPLGEVDKGKKDIFVVQGHEAERAGYHEDFRIEKDGVLKSWAVRKGVPKEEGIKVMGVQTEDHPLEYASFEGEILAGYGKGVMEILDSGSREILEWTDKHIKVKLDGKIFNGVYNLVLMKENQWLISKQKKEK